MNPASQKLYDAFINNLTDTLKVDLKVQLLEDPSIIYNHIESLKQAPKTIQNKHFLIRTYIRENDVKVVYDDFNKDKIVRTRVELPKRIDLKNKLKDVQNISTQDRLILSLFLNYPQVLRTDICCVKLKNIVKTEPHYENGIIHFPTIIKTNYTNIKINLNDEDVALISSLNTEYLYNSDCKDRNNHFGKYIKIISTKYLGHPLIINDYRRIVERELMEDYEIDEEFITRFRKLKVEVAKRGHDLATVFDHYV